MARSRGAGRFCSRPCWYKAYYAAGNATCAACGKGFHRSHRRQKSCGVACANALRRTAVRNTQCLACGKPLRPDCKPSVRFCSKSCGLKDRDTRGRLHAPEGARSRHSNGYVLVKCGKKWLLEHRHVMAQAIGRPLTKSDHVHHKNGDRADNRPENLELWSGRKDPPGQRQIDLLEDVMNQPEITRLTAEQQRGIRDAIARSIFKL